MHSALYMLRSKCQQSVKIFASTTVKWQPKIKQEDLKQEAAGDNLSISGIKRLSVIIYSTETCVDLLEARPCWLWHVQLINNCPNPDPCSLIKASKTQIVILGAVHKPSAVAATTGSFCSADSTGKRSPGATTFTQRLFFRCLMLDGGMYVRNYLKIRQSSDSEGNV